MPEQASKADQPPKPPESHGMFPPFGALPFGGFPLGPFPLGMFPFGMFPSFGLALPFWYSMFALSLLDWQGLMLMADQKTLKDADLAKLTEEGARRRAKILLELYLEAVRFRHELGKEIADWQSDWVHARLRVLEGVLGSFERKAIG